MSDWPIGISTGCYYKTPILDVLEDVRNGGFSVLEICSYPRHLDYHDAGTVSETARRMRELGLESISLHAPFANEIDITAGDEGGRWKAVDEVKRAADAAAALGAWYLVIHPGPERGGVPGCEHFDRMLRGADSLNHIAEHCLERGLHLLLENMLPHLLFGHTREILYMLGAIRHVNVGTCLDTGHAQLSGDIATVVHKLSGHLEMVHAHDNRGSWDDHLPPGQGNIDWRHVLSDLRDHHFSGSIVLELSGDSGQDSGDLLASARAGRLFLRNLLRELEMGGPGRAGVRNS